MFYAKSVYLLLGLCLGAWSIVHAAEPNIAQDGTQVLSTQTLKTTDAQGNVIEKRIVKKIRARTVVDFEEASIEGKIKKPNAAYLLHGADLDFKHLYRIKNSQRSRIMGSYEAIR